MKVLVEITQQKQIWVEAIDESKAVEQVERDYLAGKYVFDKTGKKDLLEIDAIDSKDESNKSISKAQELLSMVRKIK